MAGKQRKSVAGSIGKGLAIIQDGIDKLAAWAFAKMKDAEKIDTPKSSKKIEKNEYWEKLKVAGKKTFGFIGRVGESFYENYEELKKKRK